MVREVVQEMHLHKVEIRFVNKMLCNFLLNRCFIFINTTTLCCCRNIVPSGVTLPFLLVVKSKLLFQGFRDPLRRFTGAESTENIIVTMKHLQIFLHALDRRFSMVPVLCHRVNIHPVLEAQQGFGEGNPLACRGV